MAGFIDIVVNQFGPEEVAAGQTGFDAAFMAQVRMPEAMRGGVGIDDYLRIMDAAGVEHSLLIAVRAGDRRWKGSFEIPYEQVDRWCRAHPDRFSGLAGADPTRGLAQLKDLDEARDRGFVGVHAYPHWFSLPPDAARWYPIYARCAELDLPFMLQVGQNLIYQKDVRLPSVARPILLDQVAIDFPELTLIGIHVGTPWADEMIAMAWKHARVFIGLDAYAPKHLPAGLVQYMDSYGADKVLWGTDWPVIDPRRAVEEMRAHNLRAESFARVMRGNALKVFPALAGRMAR
ncbi:amidohydrolase family protein [Sandaracinobacteroides saxicola]|uniref:Amidohydrolase n=1 Tax=Sandaracinobacteroides saxicola TaxID=2759707 RepID=A0A7G5II98_9SPHN|nr:amidohydrolase family protein [Sandaracinobacteroides saxicola]QMW23090.1 amidohydrolase [Sandaracinobacteroides saxicola]